MSNKTNQESSKHAVTLEKVLKSKPFDALCKAAKVGLGLPNAKQKTRFFCLIIAEVPCNLGVAIHLKREARRHDHLRTSSIQHLALNCAFSVLLDHLGAVAAEVDAGGSAGERCADVAAQSIEVADVGLAVGVHALDAGDNHFACAEHHCLDARSGLSAACA